ncbi:tetratricopeptide repeat protein [Lysobacter silvisoli]|uniref:Tetratricopeptide repeat protein n=1 Tax=Lysobacter silvisoli TaxID=2293254 RepID=A0A371JZ80_9GAMM|nr:tetratricopeptide repeat protein [Lysobacter silvisoli]RDZ26985.1 tetratricopeptide repeat protein [Lysobacter silvisoli]
MSELSAALSQLHLLRPHWLWALALLPLLWLWWRLRHRRASAWRQLVDPHLLPHLIDGGQDRRSRLGLVAASLVYALAVLSLAGPSWRQSEQPLWQSRAPLVIALDLSSATLAADLPPSRLAQARAKIGQLLRQRMGGQVGLVAYAGDAFTVAPLSDDGANVAVFLDALSPDVMPLDGQRADRAINWSARLLRRAGFERGDILLLTDHGDARSNAAALQALARGYRVSVLGLGSVTGAATRRPDGSIVGVRLDESSLRALAAAGGGRYAALGEGDADLRALRVLDAGTGGASAAQGVKGKIWQDEGYWLLPPLLLLGLLAFRRRGAALAGLALCLWLPLQPARAQAQATPPAQTQTQNQATRDWWQRPDQRAHRTMQQGTQAYRSGDYRRAADLYRQGQGADAHYNRGNALAKAGQYPQAIAEYDRALQLQPGMADAIANKRAVEAAMKRKPPPGQKSQQHNPSQQGGQGQQQQPPQQSKGQAGQQPPKSPQPQPNERDESGAQREQDPAAQARAQQQADQAQRERMQRALQQRPGEQTPAQARKRAKETPEQRERRIANEAWLKRVPDDPGGLLREKFRIEYERRQVLGEDDE